MIAPIWPTQDWWPSLVHLISGMCQIRPDSQKTLMLTHKPVVLFTQTSRGTSDENRLRQRASGEKRQFCCYISDWCHTKCCWFNISLLQSFGWNCKPRSFLLVIVNQETHFRISFSTSYLKFMNLNKLKHQVFSVWFNLYKRFLKKKKNVIKLLFFFPTPLFLSFYFYSYSESNILKIFS